MTPFLRRGVEANKGARGQLEMDDLLQPPSAFVAKNNAEAFERAMLERLGGRGGGGGGGGRRRLREGERGEGGVRSRARVAAVENVRRRRAERVVLEVVQRRDSVFAARRLERLFAVRRAQAKLHDGRARKVAG